LQALQIHSANGVKLLEASCVSREQDLQANSLRLQITRKESSLESVRQINRQKPAKASVVRQPKKVYCEMIGMGAKSNIVLRAVTADFFFDCRAAEVPSDE
jgi:hypothetical protein